MRQWDAFWAGADAGAYSVIDAFTPDFLVDVSDAKAQAWKDAGLEGTWTQTISEGAAALAREAAIGAATGGLGNLASASRAAAVTTVGVRTALVGREIYEATQNAQALYQDFQEGDVWGGIGHTASCAEIRLSTDLSVLRTWSPDWDVRKLTEAGCRQRT